MKLPRERKSVVMVALAAAAAVMSLTPSASALDPSTTAVTATPSSATVDRAVTLAATVTCGSDPSTGLGVTFFDGPDLLATVPVSPTGQASLVTAFGTTGDHTITAAYNGDANCGASNATTTVSVSQAPPPNPGGTPGCLLCGLGDFHVGDIHNQISIRSAKVRRAVHG